MKDALKAYWNNLNDRERWMLGSGGVCCFFLLYYALLYAPLTDSVKEKSQQLKEKEETLVWMQKARSQYKRGTPAQALGSSQLLSVLANQLKSASFHGFSYQLQQTGAGDIQLSFDQVPYNPFVSWLWSVSQRYAFSIRQFNAERTGTPGVVKVLVTIQTS